MKHVKETYFEIYSSKLIFLKTIRYHHLGNTNLDIFLHLFGILCFIIPLGLMIPKISSEVNIDQLYMVLLFCF